MDKLLTGVVRGKTIELNEDPGFADGQAIMVTFYPNDPLASGDGITISIEATSGRPEDKKVINEILEARKTDDLDRESLE
jgi:hypothetical protein